MHSVAIGRPADISIGFWRGIHDKMAQTQELQEKKPQVSEGSADVSDIEGEQVAAWDPRSTRKLLRKLDWHIIPIMSLIYL